LPFVIHAIILGYFWLLFVTTFWLVLVNSLAIQFSGTWQPWSAMSQPTRRQANSAFHPPGSVNEYVCINLCIDLCNYMDYGGGDH